MDGVVQLCLFLQVKTFDKYMRDDEYLTNPNRCLEKESITVTLIFGFLKLYQPQAREGTALSITDVAGAFLFFTILSVVSTVVAIAEMIWSVHIRKTIN